MNARILAPLLAAVVLAACGGGNGDGGGGSERPEAGPHAKPPEDLAAPAASTYGTAYRICLNLEDVGDDPNAEAERLSQRYPQVFRDAAIQGCLGAFADRGLVEAP